MEIPQTPELLSKAKGIYANEPKFFHDWEHLSFYARDLMIDYSRKNPGFYKLFMDEEQNLLSYERTYDVDV